MLKNLSQLTVEIEGRKYHFSCDQDSPLEHAKEANFQHGKFIGQIEDAIKLKMEQEKQKEEPKQEEVK